MGEAWTKEGFREELDHLGEIEVENRLGRNFWGTLNDEKTILAKKWLAQKRADHKRVLDQAALLVADAAKRSADAAEDAAASARHQAALSIVAAIISVVAAVFTGLQLVFR